MATGEPEKMPEKMNKEMPEKMLESEKMIKEKLLESEKMNKEKPEKLLESEKMPVAPTCVEEFTKSWAQFVLGRWVLLMLLLLLLLL